MRSQQLQGPGGKNFAINCSAYGAALLSIFYMNQCNGLSRASKHPFLNLIPAGLMLQPVAGCSYIILVVCFWQAIDDLAQLCLIDESHSQSHFFQKSHFETLTMLERGDVICGFEQTGLRSGVPNPKAWWWRGNRNPFPSKPRKAEDPKSSCSELNFARSIPLEKARRRSQRRGADIDSARSHC
jgi:hypothetical protein